MTSLIQEILSSPAIVAIIYALGGSALGYLLNREKLINESKKIKAETSEIATNIYKGLIVELKNEVDRINKKFIELEKEFKVTSEEKTNLLREIKEIRERNESLLKRSEECSLENSFLVKENNRLRAQIIGLEEQIKTLMER